MLAFHKCLQNLYQVPYFCILSEIILLQVYISSIIVDLGSVDHREDRLEEEALFKLLFKIILNPKCFSLWMQISFCLETTETTCKGCYAVVQ
jgi:hypothetical protein